MHFPSFFFIYLLSGRVGCLFRRLPGKTLVLLLAHSGIIVASFLLGIVFLLVLCVSTRRNAYPMSDAHNVCVCLPFFFFALSSREGLCSHMQHPPHRPGRETGSVCKCRHVGGEKTQQMP